MAKVRLEKKQQKSATDFLFKEFAIKFTFIGLLIFALFVFIAVCFLLVPATNGFYWW